MKDYYSIIILFLVFTGIIFIYNLYVKKKNEKILRQEIRENFEKIHSKKFKGKINGIHKRLGGNVSEITSNDLNLDEVLAKMNHTMSKMGLEFFYYRLRDLILDKDELTRLQEKRRLYEGKEEDLEDLQFHLGKLGYFKEDVLELIEEEIEIQRELEVLAKVFSFTAIYILILFISLRA